MPKQDVAVEIFIDGAWTDLVLQEEVFSDTPITITRGNTSESSSVRPSSITLRLDNRTDKYRTSNPMSPYYGKAGVNTQLRVSVAGVVRGIGEITSWRCSQSRDFKKSPRRGKAWTDITANGIFWRINSWTELVQSTMRRGMSVFNASSLGSWPLEDGQDTVIVSNIVPGGFSAKYTGEVTFGETERPLGSAKTVKLGTAGEITGKFLSSGNSGYQVSFGCKLAGIPGSATDLPMLTWYDSAGRRWDYSVDSTTFNWQVYDSDGTLITATGISFTGQEPNNWIRYRMKVSVSAGTVTAEPSWYKESDNLIFGTSFTFSGAITGQPTRFQIAANTHNTNAWYTGVFALSNTTSNIFSSQRVADYNGQVGETAGARWDRLFGDLGISTASNGDNTLSAPMGAQPVATMSSLIEEIVNTEDGIVFDSRTSVAPVISLRNFRYNQTPVSIDVRDPDTSGLSNLPDEVTDDLDLFNIVTLDNTNGGEITVEDSTSSMGTQSPPDGRGEYRKTINVNLDDPDLNLPKYANWWLKRGTVDLPRYPTVMVNLTNLTPARITQLEAITIGTVLTLENYREYTIRLYVIGYVETITTHSRVIKYTCAPDQQFVVSTYNSTTARYGTMTATLAEDLEITETSVDITAVARGDCFGSRDLPYGILIGGELMVVTAVGSISGSGPYTQTLTVTRGCNGIFKTHPTGASIQVETPGRYAL